VVLTADTDASADGRTRVWVLHKPAGADKLLAALGTAAGHEQKPAR
jgi:hypothetical protein